MGRHSSAYYYKITRKNPGPLRPGSIRALVYEAMKKLRVAGEEQIIDTVMAHKDFKSRQDEPKQQIKWYLWQLSEREGFLKRLPNRRYRSAVRGEETAE